MGGKIRISFTQLSPPPPPPPPNHHHHNLPSLYYGLAVIGTTAILLAIYNLIVLRCCKPSSSAQSQEESTPNLLVHEVSATSTRRYVTKDFLSSSKYKKEEREQDCTTDFYECAVCLSVFEDGEEIKTLPKCSHSFHVSCIDMWLYSHSDCPLCRTPVPLTPPHYQYPTDTLNENSRDV